MSKEQSPAVEFFKSMPKEQLHSIKQQVEDYLKPVEGKVRDWDEDDFDFEDEYFIDSIEDAVGTELFSHFTEITHVRIGNRAWKITLPFIEEDPESQTVRLIEIDPKEIEHLP